MRDLEAKWVLHKVRGSKQRTICRIISLRDNSKNSRNSKIQISTEVMSQMSKTISVMVKSLSKA